MVSRISISIDKKLLDNFDKIGYPKRSEAISDLIRHHVAEQKKDEVDMLIKIVYDHRKNRNVASLENDYPCMIRSSMQVHLDHHRSLQLIVTRGKPERLEHFVARIKQAEGVKKISTETL